MKVDGWPKRPKQPQSIVSCDNGVLNRFASGHPAGDDLELYAVNRLIEPNLGYIEEHLLVCEQCRSSLTELDEFVAMMRAAAPRKGR